MAKLKTVIFGAGGFGREVLPFVRLNKKLAVTHFVDLKPQSEKIDGVPVLEENEFWVKYKKLGIKAVVVTIGEPAIRAKIIAQIKKVKLALPVIIHPSTVLAADFSCGEGTIIYPLVTAQVRVRVGEGVLLNAGSTIGHDTIIDDYVNVNPGVHLAGNVRVRKTTFLGQGCNVVEKITIGENTTIGAGAVVIDNIPANVIAVGIPARVIRTLGV